MSGWQVQRNALVRELAFRDYEEAKAFADYIAEHVDDYHRHPDLVITLNRVRVVIANLHHAGVTRAEERLAGKVDAVLAARADEVSVRPG
ncbi:MAG: Pterin 4 alpha carbinolamine dehydratase [Solirubrobacteraceae bacterium]|nr:Pterin 4 alpha carbinolamine dehydratase [Solirubrobacteraceae bacterium]